MLTDVEREHLFLLGLGRPPRSALPQGPGRQSRACNSVLDSLNPSPAVIKTATWDVIAWNRAAAPGPA
ncbi:MAG: hypothetical protein WDN06_22520 [Asticcacaulis sp.]